jgi:hypothetical protein
LGAVKLAGGAENNVGSSSASRYSVVRPVLSVICRRAGPPAGGPWASGGGFREFPDFIIVRVWPCFLFGRSPLRSAPHPASREEALFPSPPVIPGTTSPGPRERAGKAKEASPLGVGTGLEKKRESCGDHFLNDAHLPSEDAIQIRGGECWLKRGGLERAWEAIEAQPQSAWTHASVLKTPASATGAVREKAEARSSVMLSNHRRSLAAAAVKSVIACLRPRASAPR